MAVTVRTLGQAEIAERLSDLARLRIAVFREWPYLYDGDDVHEAEYLTAFANAPHAVLAAAFDGAQIVGMATASPLSAQDDAIRLPVAAAGIDPADSFYFGESVLLPQARGQRIGHAFFEHREAGARAAGARRALFCSVIRPETHPMKPADARSHHDFWSKRGYAPLPDVTCALRWRDLDEGGETTHRLQFWHREL